MTTEKPIIEKELLDDVIYNLDCISNYQNEIISCIDEAGFSLYELKDVLEDFPRELDESTEKLSDLLDAAHRLEDWAIGHHQIIQELGEVMTKIEKTQNRKRGRKC